MLMTHRERKVAVVLFTALLVGLAWLLNDHGLLMISGLVGMAALAALVLTRKRH